MKKVFFCVLLTAVLCNVCVASEEETFALNRHRMMEQQIERRGITDKRVLDAMREVKRHLFVPAHLRPRAYDDNPLPIGHGQTISQPYVVAYMTQALMCKPQDRVLEIGTGSGYQAAILAEIAKEVYTIEILRELGDPARELLHKLGYQNIKVKIGDGYQGWREHAPFDAIIVTAAPAEIPEELMYQLKVGGRMVVPVGGASQRLYLIQRTETGFKKESLLPVVFVPMVHGKKEDLPLSTEEIISLPKPLIKGKMSLEEAILKRRSKRNFSKQELDLQQIGQLLWSAQGITTTRGALGLRSAPSAGALYPIELYLLTKNGLFHYLPVEHSLKPLSRKDLREGLSAVALGQSAISQAPVSIVICAVYTRTTAKYGERGIRYAHIEVGHVAQNIHLQAVALGLGSVPIGAFNDEEVKKILSLPIGQEPLYIIPAGY